MSSPRETPPATARGEDGVGLIEVVVVSAILAIVVVAILNVLDTAVRQVPKDVEWTHAIAEGRVGMARLVRELRQAERINGATPNRLDFEVPVGGVTRRVMYACDVPEAEARRRCTRVEAPAGGVLPAPSTGDRVVARVLNGTPEDPVFTYTPDAIGARYVRARVLVPASGARRAEDGFRHPVVLEDGAYLRNQDLGG